MRRNELQPYAAIVTDADMLNVMGGRAAPTSCRDERDAYYGLALVRLAEAYGSEAVQLAIRTRTLPAELLDHLDGVRVAETNPDAV